MTLGASAPESAIHSLRDGVWQTANSTLSLAGQLISRSLALLPFSASASHVATQLQLPQEYVSLQVSLLSGTEVHLRIVSSAASRRATLPGYLLCSCCAVAQ